MPPEILFFGVLILIVYIFAMWMQFSKPWSNYE